MLNSFNMINTGPPGCHLFYYLKLLKFWPVLAWKCRWPLELLWIICEQCCWREPLGGTEGLFVLPSSYESWFWLAKEPARISPLWCDGPGTLHPHPSLLETPTSLTQYGWCQAPSASSRWGLNEQCCKAKQYSNRNGRTGVVSGGGGGETATHKWTIIELVHCRNNWLL